MTRLAHCSALITLVLVLAGQAHAQSDVGLKAAVLVRALSYDEGLKSRAGDEVVIAVLHANDSGRAAAAPLAAELRKLSRMTIQGLPMRVVELRYAAPDDLKKAVGSHGVDVLFVGRELGDAAGDITRVSRELGLATITDDEELVRKSVSVAAVLAPGASKPRIIVNLGASRAEGLRLRAELLRLAEVLR